MGFKPRGVDINRVGLTAERAERACSVCRALLVRFPLAGVASFRAAARLRPPGARNDQLGVGGYTPEALEDANVLECHAFITLCICRASATGAAVVIIALKDTWRPDTRERESK